MGWILLAVAASCFFYIFWSIKGWKKIRTLKYFFLHDGNLQPPGFWGTMVATNTAVANGFFLYLVLGYYYGWGAFLWSALFWVGAIGVFQLAIKRVGGEFTTLVTLHEFLGQRARTRGINVRRVVAFITAFSFLLTLSMELVVGSQIFFALLAPHSVPPQWAMVIVPLLLALPIAAYLTIGGFPAAVRSDIIQVVAFIPGLALLAYVAFPTAVATAKTTTISQFLMLDQWSFIIFSMFSWSMWFLVGMDMWQRCAATGSSTSPRRPLWLSLVFLIPFTAIAIACGIYARTSPDPQAASSPAPQVFIDMILLHSNLPLPLIALVYVALVAAILSTVDTFMMVVAHSVFADIYLPSKGADFKNLGPEAQREFLGRIRVFLLFLPLVCALGFAFVVYIAGANVVAMNYISYSIPLCLLPAVIIAMKKGSVSGKGTIIGAMCGAIAVIAYCVPLALQISRSQDFELINRNLKLLYATPAIAAFVSGVCMLFFIREREAPLPPSGPSTTPSAELTEPNDNLKPEENTSTEPEREQ